MKTSTILAGFLIIISQTSFANQSADSKRPDMTVLATQLHLDDSQSQQLKEIMQDHHKTIKQLHQEKQQNRETMHTLRNQHREQLLTILDHQQLYQLETYMQQFKPQRKSHKKSD